MVRERTCYLGPDLSTGPTSVLFIGLGLSSNQLPDHIVHVSADLLATLVRTPPERGMNVFHAQGHDDDAFRRWDVHN